MLEEGAEEALSSAGASVGRELIELDWDFTERSGSGEDDACFEIMGMVSERVAAARGDGAFPVILSGSCFAAVGAVAGIGERSPGVVWLDAHSDFNTPEITVEGYLDGMGLAMLTGGAWQQMVAGIPGAKPLPETATLLAGARDFDELEKARLDDSRVAWVQADDMRTPEALLDAIERLDPAPSGLYLHIDLDVLDAEEACVNVFSAPGGVSGDELVSLVAAVLERHPVRAMSLTAYDPAQDPEGRVPAIASRLLAALAERTAAGASP